MTRIIIKKFLDVLLLTLQTTSNCLISLINILARTIFSQFTLTWHLADVPGAKYKLIKSGVLLDDVNAAYLIVSCCDDGIWHMFIFSTSLLATFFDINNACERSFTTALTSFIPFRLACSRLNSLSLIPQPGWTNSPIGHVILNVGHLRDDDVPPKVGSFE